MVKNKRYIIIPTYKEAENLRELLPILRKYNVIIVDDNSQDGTEEICRKFRNVKLIIREKKLGLASAVLTGIRSIREKDASVVVTDADFEHDYNSIGRMFDLLSRYDFVEGVKKGKRLPSRGLISRLGTVFVKTLVPESKWLKDPMSGFFGFRLKSVNVERIKPIGYKIMLEVFMNLKKGSKKTHFPYPYGYRKHGKSKLSLLVMLQFVWQVLRLNNYRLALFLSIGIFGIFFNEFLLYEFYFFMPLIYALVYAIVISTLVNFLMNHYITFKARSPFSSSLAKFIGVTAASGVINLVVAYSLSLFMLYLLANFVGILIAFLFKYVFSEGYVWRTDNH